MKTMTKTELKASTFSVKRGFIGPLFMPYYRGFGNDMMKRGGGGNAD